MNQGDSTTSNPAMKHPYGDLLADLVALQEELKKAEKVSVSQLDKVDPVNLPGCLNMVHYLSLRSRDMRPLQARLAAAGLSSLGRMESRVLANLNAVVDLLRCAMGAQTPESIVVQDGSGNGGLEFNTNRLFGKPPLARRSRIMVTLPADAADDYALIRDMLVHGMDCARINCAHDEPEVWARMIEQINHAKSETGRQCRILMDLGGPKLRTGAIAPGPAVLKWRPSRDSFGKTATPARVWLYPESEAMHPHAPADANLPIEGDWLKSVAPQDEIRFTDARGAGRSLRVVDKMGNGFWAEADQTAYVLPGTDLKLVRASRGGHQSRTRLGKVGKLPPQPGSIRLKPGEFLTLTREPLPGQPAQFDAKGRLIMNASISCSLPEIFTQVKSGERILIDDGKIAGVIRSSGKNKILVEVTQARADGEKLLPDKGINLPDSHLKLDALTKQDIKHLKFVVRHADMVGMSFVRHPEDVLLLQKHLKALGAEKMGIVLKVETRAAFENLPDILLTLMRSPAIGVMIARGDLAVECGYERLAELQEEILWLAEAAHLPVIWATQVLEELSKSGMPSRAEITDAAMGVRAECVMLNKGAHIIEAISTLDDILHRMQSHQSKKSSLLRRLHWK
jgi:pyruvate kinase